MCSQQEPSKLQKPASRNHRWLLPKPLRPQERSISRGTVGSCSSSVLLQPAPAHTKCPATAHRACGSTTRYPWAPREPRYPWIPPEPSLGSSCTALGSVARNSQEQTSAA